MPSSKSISTTVDNVISAAARYPSAKGVLEELFPDAFSENKVYCKLGTIFLREGYDNLYALIKWNGEVRFLNITNNQFWSAEKNIKVGSLLDATRATITVGEFKRLTEGENFNSFIPLEGLLAKQITQFIKK